MDEKFCVRSEDFEWAMTSHSLTFEIQEFRKPEYRPVLTNTTEGEVLYGHKAYLEAAATFYSGGLSLSLSLSLFSLT